MWIITKFDERYFPRLLIYCIIFKMHLKPEIFCFRVAKKKIVYWIFCNSNSCRHAKESIALQKLSVARWLEVEILLTKGYGLDDRYNSFCYIRDQHYDMLLLTFWFSSLNNERNVECKLIRWKHFFKITL